ncbi:uncharacterized protein LOC111640231 [Centruroides sculpturatus]|uniref:uncharacterized protein LOC111640231 n=1 Tax=Centruroides sculpturatus TaxID=218467 RepID=UPI000C6E8F09|nr:uncharacterized protein LOC111640231 [Centruroides sculpturatus]
MAESKWDDISPVVIENLIDTINNKVTKMTMEAQQENSLRMNHFSTHLKQMLILIRIKYNKYYEKLEELHIKKISPSTSQSPESWSDLFPIDVRLGVVEDYLRFKKQLLESMLRLIVSFDDEVRMTFISPLLRMALIDLDLV